MLLGLCNVSKKVEYWRVFRYNGLDVTNGQKNVKQQQSCR